MRTLRLLQTKKELVLLALCYIYVLFFPNEAPLELGIRVSDDEKYIFIEKVDSNHVCCRGRVLKKLVLLRKCGAYQILSLKILTTFEFSALSAPLATRPLLR